MSIGQTTETVRIVTVRGRWFRIFIARAPDAAIVWSFIYAILGVYWALSGNGLPFVHGTVSEQMQPLAGRFGPVIAWILVVGSGIPSAALGVAMRRGMNAGGLRPFFLAAGTLLTTVLLLMMTGLDLLILFGYIPYAVFSVFSGAEIGPKVLQAWTQWATIHQLFCLLGGFLWLAATVSYRRRSRDACLYCGRSSNWEDRHEVDRATRYGRIAVYVSMVAPAFYALTRIAWALGFPLGITEEYLRQGQQSGMWISGLFLAAFGLVGALLQLGLVQRWGEKFPRWMVGLAGRRVPVALAVFPAAFVSVLLVVGGVGIWSSLSKMVAVVEAQGHTGFGIFWSILIQVGPTLLFPIWGVALAIATVCYSRRRRGPCRECGCGASTEPPE